MTVIGEVGKSVTNIVKGKISLRQAIGDVINGDLPYARSSGERKVEKGGDDPIAMEAEYAKRLENWEPLKNGLPNRFEQPKDLTKE